MTTKEGKNAAVIGVDLGGTKVRAARIVGDRVLDDYQINISSSGSKEQVLEEIKECISSIWHADVKGIGMGVPSVLDLEKGIVYDVQNIPSWKEVHVKDFLSNEFNVPAVVNNDANCFALGEKYFGKGQPYDNMVGIIMGTGMAGGIIVDGKLYSGKQCGAGEFGLMPYLDHYYEYYCSGQFFTREYGQKGEQLSALAADGDTHALEVFKEFGSHVGNVLKAIFYAIDPEIIVLGGSVSKAFPYFIETVRESLKDLAFQNMASVLQIKASENEFIPVLGAAALYYDSLKTPDKQIKTTSNSVM